VKDAASLEPMPLEQDVFYELVEANRLLVPIEHVTGWLFRVALYARNVLLDEFELTVDELPKEQRDVFVAHELEGRSFKEMAAETGVSMNTLLSRKRYAVLRLRERLQPIYDELTKA
jgi:hypothetical protein